MYHIHPYSIAKTMGHNIVKFYRDNYNFPFSNGILFTIESPLKRKEFLLNKVANHIKNWNTDKTPLVLGSLDSNRILLHADDAANAIKVILEQNNGDDYIICGNENNKVSDIVSRMYNKININLEKDGNKLVDKNSKEVIIIIENINIGYDTQKTNIIGYPQKLYNLGWRQKYDLDYILSDMN
jgi:GDP-D-mannose dehydratase